MYDRELLVIVRHKFIKAAARYPLTPLGVWRAVTEVLDGLRAVGVTVPTVWPMYVYRRKDGAGFGARTHLGKAPRTRVELPGPFPTAEAAHLAFVAHLKAVRRADAANDAEAADGAGATGRAGRVPTVSPVR
jgi:hypothetical protein